jgi:acetoacetyl-CoA synthetase
MPKLLWEPSDAWKSKANMTAFMDLVNQRYGKALSSYGELYDWSVRNIGDFWECVWDVAEVRASRRYDEVVDDPYRMPGARWFSGARMNFAENLLRYRDDHTALIFHGENQTSRRVSYREFYDMVARLAVSLRDLGVSVGDRVVAYMPNMIETAAAMLATTSIGAVWSSCATDIGPEAALDRLGQVEPKVLFTVDGYYYKGKQFDTVRNAAQVAASIPSLQRVVVVSYGGGRADIGQVPHAIRFDEFLRQSEGSVLDFEQLPSDHPVYIMFSSGTTGKPKCMVQAGTGVLVNHFAEVVLHADLTREDTIMYITTCSWMMWNWHLSSLVKGATIVLYDGNPSFPDPGAMWKLVQDEKISIFGTSATYLSHVRSQGLAPGEQYDLSSLREINQTGSALPADGWEWVYESVKKDLYFCSISGGTDFNGAFAAGNPLSPIYAGQMQGWALGKKCKAYDEKGNPVLDRQGELVCEASIPSMPLYFWNDPDGEKYRQAYFSIYPNVWRHGDYIQIHSDTGGITFFGRSDSTLNPSGVRIGTAEIYNQVEKLEQVADSLAIGQSWHGDQRIVLFVKLAQGYQLTDDLKDKIRRTLRVNASPRHVPAKIIEVPDIPYTLNMKKVESAVTNAIHGKPVLNRDALVNPQVLDYYQDLEELKS